MPHTKYQRRLEVVSFALFWRHTLTRRSRRRGMIAIQKPKKLKPLPRRKKSYQKGELRLFLILRRKEQVPDIVDIIFGHESAFRV